MQTKETYSIMLCAVLLKKSVTSKEDLWDIYSSTQRKKWQIVWWKQQHSYCFPKKPAKLFCVQITVLEAEWHIAWFAAALTFSFLLPFTLMLSSSCCHMCWCASAPDGSCHKSPTPTHALPLPHDVTQWLARWWATCLQMLLPPMYSHPCVRIIMYQIYNHKGFTFFFLLLHRPKRIPGMWACPLFLTSSFTQENLSANTSLFYYIRTSLVVNVVRLEGFNVWKVSWSCQF